MPRAHQDGRITARLRIWHCGLKLLCNKLPLILSHLLTWTFSTLCAFLKGCSRKFCIGGVAVVVAFSLRGWDFSPLHWIQNIFCFRAWVLFILFIYCSIGTKVLTITLSSGAPLPDSDPRAPTPQLNLAWYSVDFRFREVPFLVPWTTSR